MKKLFKVLIALVIIAAIAFGVYFLFGGKTDNSQIYFKANQIEKMEPFAQVNKSINDMIADINASGYDMDEIKTYFLTYNQVMSNYQLISNEIEKNGLFVNSNNTGNYFKAMNGAHDALVACYNQSKDYLARTYWLSKSKVYIENFYNIFKDNIKNLNSFYYNAGMAYLIATNTNIETNNLYKLNLECYLLFANSYTQNFIDGGANATKILDELNSKVADVNANNFDQYIANIEIYNALQNGGIDKTLLVNKFISGEIETYLTEIQNEQQKLNYENYYNYIIK